MDALSGTSTGASTTTRPPRHIWAARLRPRVRDCARQGVNLLVLVSRARTSNAGLVVRSHAPAVAADTRSCSRSPSPPSRVSSTWCTPHCSFSRPVRVVRRGPPTSIARDSGTPSVRSIQPSRVATSHRGPPRRARARARSPRRTRRAPRSTLARVSRRRASGRASSAPRSLRGARSHARAWRGPRRAPAVARGRTPPRRQWRTRKSRSAGARGSRSPGWVERKCLAVARTPAVPARPPRRRCGAWP